MTEKFLCAPVCMSVLYTLSKILALRRSFNSFGSPILHSFFGVRVSFLLKPFSSNMGLAIFISLYKIHMEFLFSFLQCQNVTITSALDILYHLSFCYYETNFVLFIFYSSIALISSFSFYPSISQSKSIAFFHIGFVFVDVGMRTIYGAVTLAKISISLALLFGCACLNH